MPKLERMGSGAELHFHLLPGLDDGPATIDDSLQLARAAAADGTGTIVATPHVRQDFVSDVSQLPARVAELRAVLAEEAVPVTVLCGGELGHELVGRLGQEELETIAQGPPRGRWLLVEAPFEGIGDDFHAATEELRDRGFGVLLAHPERSADATLDDARGLRRELAAGSLAQLNALSLTGGHGNEAKQSAARLARGGLATVVSSDAHGTTRPPALRAAEDALEALGLTRETARRLTHRVPRRLLTRGIGRTPVVT